MNARSVYKIPEYCMKIKKGCVLLTIKPPTRAKSKKLLHYGLSGGCIFFFSRVVIRKADDISQVAEV